MKRVTGRRSRPASRPDAASPTPIGQVSGARESEVEARESRTAMNHVHLPKLVEDDFVEWDREHDEVSKGPEFVEIRPLFELLDDHADDLPDGWL